jgi:hypothetical protein
MMRGGGIMTAKELKMRLDRFDDEQIHIRIADYGIDASKYAHADMDSIYVRKDGDHVDLIFGGSFEIARR